MMLRSSCVLLTVHAAMLIIGVVSIFSYLTFFPSSFRGWPEITPYNSVAGWVVNEAAPMRSVEVQLYIDGHFVADGMANISRPDVVAAGRAKQYKCGFNLALPPLSSGEHEAQIYIAHQIGTGAYRTLKRLGKPLQFKIR